ncbi:hypothetical protein F5148DRAFT_1283352 [Russula earlei]|uniref:Uncharacterized protein n=1 Tax=Russula earlei TaxID=71964 RepID=A0ACC0UDV3_9AGAM|nr:hypothetical protein F5148DRAFT_1283352 [Russula earlei]
MAHSDSSSTLPPKKNLMKTCIVYSRSWIVWCLLAAATMTLVSITVGWYMGTLDLKGSSPRPTAARNVLFTLDLVSLDPVQNTVTFDWWIVSDDCADLAAESTAPVPQCPVVDIYVNPTQFMTNTGGPLRQNPSDDQVASQPTFQHNATAFALGGPAFRAAFRTQLDIRPHPSRARVDLVDYPFEKYPASASIVAQTNDTGEAIGAWIYNLTGAAYGFSANLDSISVDANMVTSVNILAGRALSVKFYVITIILGMWLVSLALMMATIKAAIFHHKIDSAVLVLPIGTMIAFAQLRASMPNAPAGFGTNIGWLDFR